MNTPFFACPNCRVYVDAGYRWAYWLLEDTGIVTHNGGVDVRAVMGCDDYWNPPTDEQSDWLYKQVLPAVREFLTEHEPHGIIYTDEDVIDSEDSLFFNWKRIEI